VTAVDLANVTFRVDDTEDESSAAGASDANKAPF